MKYKHVLFDMEGDGMHPTKIHCMSFWLDGEFKSTTNYDTMRYVLLNTENLYGHNIILWDIPHLERLLNIKITARVIDTLALSWYLYPKLNRHGLAVWGEYFGVPKPKVETDEWLTPVKKLGESSRMFEQRVQAHSELMLHRCDQDTRINFKLWEKQESNLLSLYNNDIDQVNKLIDYLSFKLKCVQLAEQHKFKLDLDLVNSSIKKFTSMKEELTANLSGVMPKMPIVKTFNRPKIYTKKNGDLSARAKIWEIKCNNLGLDIMINSFEETVGYEEPNPSSHKQIKDWLYSLGWEPVTFNYVREDDGSNRKVPQVKDGDKLCRSVEELISIEPNIEVLKTLSIVSHRLNIFKKFLRDQSEGYITASIVGFTNTLRFRHSKLNKTGLKLL